MSKRRQQLDPTSGEISTPPEEDLRAYVIFTQLKENGPFIYAGWLDAADDEMAIVLAIQHYGRDQECTQIWAAPREFVGGMKENAGAAEEPVSQQRDYQIFTQKNAGDQHFSAITTNADSASSAINQAENEIKGGTNLHNIWAIPVDEILHTDRTQLIWDNIDQTYRLARGYSKDVRQKWETIRAQRDIDEYEQEDLKESF